MKHCHALDGCRGLEKLLQGAGGTDSSNEPGHTGSPSRSKSRSRRPRQEQPGPLHFSASPTFAPGPSSPFGGAAEEGLEAGEGPAGGILRPGLPTVTPQALDTMASLLDPVRSGHSAMVMGCPPGALRAVSYLVPVLDKVRAQHAYAPTCMHASIWSWHASCEHYHSSL